MKIRLDFHSLRTSESFRHKVPKMRLFLWRTFKDSILKRFFWKFSWDFPKRTRDLFKRPINRLFRLFPSSSDKFNLIISEDIQLTVFQNLFLHFFWASSFLRCCCVSESFLICLAWSCVFWFDFDRPFSKPQRIARFPSFQFSLLLDVWCDDRSAFPSFLINDQIIWEETCRTIRKPQPKKGQKIDF